MDDTEFPMPEQMKREFKRPLVTMFECPFCGRSQPTGYCSKCGEWTTTDQDAVAAYYERLGRWF
jgi:hypothetical protein